MFDFGWQEFMLIAFVAVVVVGPRDLPRVVRSVSMYVRKARGVAREFQNSLEEVAREAELDELRKEARSISGGNLEKKMNEWVDPSGETRKEMERIASQAKDATVSRPVRTDTEPAAGSPPAGSPATASGTSEKPAGNPGQAGAAATDDSTDSMAEAPPRPGADPAPRTAAGQ